MPDQPLVSIVVPHYNGKEMLYQCLRALANTTYPECEIIVVNNASTDGSVDSLSKDFPNVKLINSERNDGYAGGCNLGYAASGGEFVLFLNNDTVFEPVWLDPLVARMLDNAEVAAVQPKLLAFDSPDTFDYSGAAGGLMDLFGFPFALGRVFFEVEKDTGQYNTSRQIFWASGTAMLTRRSALQEVGVFDEGFFAHMEEIDLNWRLQLAGYKIVSEPKSVVLHNSGSTLKATSFKKMYLNHRNSVLMLWKNYGPAMLMWVLPIRMAFDVMALCYALCKGDFTRAGAIPAAFVGVACRLPATLIKRTRIQKKRKVSDAEIRSRMYTRSIVLDHFVRGICRVQDLKSAT